MQLLCYGLTLFHTINTLENELIVSFHVESTLLYSSGRSGEWPQPCRATMYPCSDCCSPDFPIKINTLQANGAIYEKLGGTAMRSTISAVTGTIEEQAKTSSY